MAQVERTVNVLLGCVATRGARPVQLWHFVRLRCSPHVASRHEFAFALAMLVAWVDMHAPSTKGCRIANFRIVSHWATLATV